MKVKQYSYHVCWSFGSWQLSFSPKFNPEATVAEALRIIRERVPDATPGKRMLHLVWLCVQLYVWYITVLYRAIWCWENNDILMKWPKRLYFWSKTWTILCESQSQRWVCSKLGNPATIHHQTPVTLIVSANYSILLNWSYLKGSVCVCVCGGGGGGGEPTASKAVA